MARRKKSSPLEDVLDLLAMLPWWVCLVLAALTRSHILRQLRKVGTSVGQGDHVAG